MAKFLYISMKDEKLKPPFKIIVFILFIIMCFVLLNTSFVANIWFLMIEPVYVIPSESTIFKFKATKMNPGSGDWWIYGEDIKCYYYFTGNKENPYKLISKEKSKDCVGFNPHDFATWCLE